MDPELQAEKERLLSEGMREWSRQHYNNFVKASAKYGRTHHASIAAEVGKTEAEVALYAAKFWEVAPTALPSAEFESVLKRVEKGERKLGEIERLTIATEKFLALWQHPLSQVVKTWSVQK